jgi:hypothetical protein
MSRRIDIELTSTREDGSWTWRAAGAREPRGTLEASIVPSGVEVGQVVRAEIEGYLDGLSVVAVLPPRAPRAEPERLELKPAGRDQPLVTSTVTARRSGDRDRGRHRDDRARDGRDTRERRGRREGDEGRRDRRRTRDRQDARHERASRPAPPPLEEKPKPKRLRPARAHRSALLEAVPAEQRPIAEQLLAGGIPSVRQAIEKQNEELRAAGKPEVKPDALLRIAEDLRPRALAAGWRDRAEAAAAIVDELDLRDLRSVVNAAGDAGRDEESRALASQLREALANRVEKEHAAWLAELAETVGAGRVVRALRLSSRPPKAGAPIPGDIATQLAEATAASLTSDTGPDRWSAVLEALAFSPVRRRVIPQSLPSTLAPELRTTIARLASRLPDIAHIFDIEPDPAAERAARRAPRRPARKGPGAGKQSGGRSGGGKSAGEKVADDKDKAPTGRASGRKGPKGGKGPKGPAPTEKSEAEAATPVTEPEAEAATPVTEPEAEAATPVTEPEPEAEAATPVTEPEAEAATPVIEPERPVEPPEPETEPAAAPNGSEAAIPDTADDGVPGEDSSS